MGYFFSDSVPKKPTPVTCLTQFIDSKYNPHFILDCRLGRESHREPEGAILPKVGVSHALWLTENQQLPLTFTAYSQLLCLSFLNEVHPVNTISTIVLVICEFNLHVSIRECYRPSNLAYKTTHSSLHR